MNLQLQPDPRPEAACRHYLPPPQSQLLGRGAAPGPGATCHSGYGGLGQALIPCEDDGGSQGQPDGQGHTGRIRSQPLLGPASWSRAPTLQALGGEGGAGDSAVTCPHLPFSGGAWLHLSRCPALGPEGGWGRRCRKSQGEGPHRGKRPLPPRTPLRPHSRSRAPPGKAGAGSGLPQAAPLSFSYSHCFRMSSEFMENLQRVIYNKTCTPDSQLHPNALDLLRC